MKSLAVLHASELVTLRGPNRPRVGAEMSDLAIVRDGGRVLAPPSHSAERDTVDSQRTAAPSFCQPAQDVVAGVRRLAARTQRLDERHAEGAGCQRKPNVIGIVATLVIGTIAGIYPAMRAARLSPTVALSTT